MSESRYKEWILDSIDSLRSRKARPDRERICRMVERRHGACASITQVALERLVASSLVVKVSYKGSHSYRNAAKCRRGRTHGMVLPPSSSPVEKENDDDGGGGGGVGEEEEQEDDGGCDNEGGGGGGGGDGGGGPGDNEDAGGDGKVVPADAAAVEAGGDDSTPAKSDDDDVDDDHHDGGDGPGGIGDDGSTMGGGGAAPDTPATPAADAAAAAAADKADRPGSGTRSRPGREAGTARPFSSATSAAAAIGGDDDGGDSSDSDCESNVPAPDSAGTPGREKGGGGRVGVVLATPSLPMGRTGLNRCSLTALAPTVWRELGEWDDRCLCACSAEGLKLLEPADWSIADVVSYFRTAGFEEEARAFQEQEIDGKSLLLMKRSDVLTGLSIKLGPALKIYEFHVKALQSHHFHNDASY
ncbi:unnamed protein product [Lampetra fluviatilis]